MPRLGNPFEISKPAIQQTHLRRSDDLNADERLVAPAQIMLHIILSTS
jgi:hypothetical protein